MLQKILLEVVTATKLYSLSMVGTPPVADPLSLSLYLYPFLYLYIFTLCLWWVLLMLPDALSAFLPVKPFLAKAPENVSTDAGSTARFSCAVDGVPKPKVFFSSLDDLCFLQLLCNTPHPYYSSQVVWVKAGSKLSPGRTEVEDGAVLKIRGVTSSDAGEYRCAAENIAGAIETSAFLQIQSENNGSRWK